jgi:hypothetical protein
MDERAIANGTQLEFVTCLIRRSTLFPAYGVNIVTVSSKFNHLHTIKLGDRHHAIELVL